MLYKEQRKTSGVRREELVIYLTSRCVARVLSAMLMGRSTSQSRCGNQLSLLLPPASSAAPPRSTRSPIWTYSGLDQCITCFLLGSTRYNTV